MNLRAALFVILATPMTMDVAAADEAVWPDGPASEVATFATRLRYQIYADHCSGEVPRLEAEFDRLMESLDRRIQDMSARLLSSPDFNGMKNQVVPVEILIALKHSFHDMAHNVESLDAASSCPAALRNFAEMDDGTLETSLTANFTAVQNMSEKSGKARAP